jgi:hypothetical protein
VFACVIFIDETSYPTISASHARAYIHTHRLWSSFLSKWKEKSGTARKTSSGWMTGNLHTHTHTYTYTRMYARVSIYLGIINDAHNLGAARFAHSHSVHITHLYCAVVYMCILMFMYEYQHTRVCVQT